MYLKMTQNILEYFFLHILYIANKQKQGNVFHSNNGCNYDTIYVLYLKNDEIHLKYQLSRLPTKSPHGILSLYTRRHISFNFCSFIATLLPSKIERTNYPTRFSIHYTFPFP